MINRSSVSLKHVNKNYACLFPYKPSRVWRIASIEGDPTCYKPRLTWLPVWPSLSIKVLQGVYFETMECGEKKKSKLPKLKVVDKEYGSRKPNNSSRSSTTRCNVITTTSIEQRISEYYTWREIRFQSGLCMCRTSWDVTPRHDVSTRWYMNIGLRAG